MSRFKWSDDEVGLIVTVNGVVQGVEIFRDKMGLRRDYGAILKERYAPRAIRNAGGEMTYQDVNNGISSFLSELNSGMRQAQVVNHGGNLAYACAV